MSENLRELIATHYFVSTGRAAVTYLGRAIHLLQEDEIPFLEYERKRILCRRVQRVRVRMASAGVDLNPQARACVICRKRIRKSNLESTNSSPILSPAP